ncbi:hypothetical protein Cni_G02098 [Canna indica]|uniref:Uncharacterized protein n=1 Tax=Canna indica TaxID=4628 RepID=A0AAQ3JRK1_9LILI|nr:hypothetical protein Cni_G02098 [Canna indica]
MVAVSLQRLGFVSSAGPFSLARLSGTGYEISGPLGTRRDEETDRSGIHHPHPLSGLVGECSTEGRGSEPPPKQPVSAKSVCNLEAKSEFSKDSECMMWLPSSKASQHKFPFGSDFLYRKHIGNRLVECFERHTCLTPETMSQMIAPAPTIITFSDDELSVEGRNHV